MIFRKVLILILVFVNFNLFSQFNLGLSSESAGLPPLHNPASYTAYHTFQTSLVSKMYNFDDLSTNFYHLQFDIGTKIMVGQSANFTKNYGLAVGFNYFRFGDKNINNERFTFTLNKNFELNKNNLTFGFSFGIEKIILKPFENLKQITSIKPIDFGFLWFKKKQFLGISVNNVFVPNNVADNNLPSKRHFSLHYGMRFKIKKLNITNTFMYQNISSFNSITSQLLFSFFKEKLSIGLGYRINQNYIFSITANHRRFQFSYFYDLYNPQITNHNIYAHEIKLSYLIKKKNNYKQDKCNCLFI